MREADKASNNEQSRRIEELSHLSEEEIQHRMAVANKLLEVQKELLSTHTPTKVLTYTSLPVVHFTQLAHCWLSSS